MREIKFRAWYGNRMYYDANDFYLRMDGSCFEIFNGETDAPTWGQPKLMQWTGLKDKNGKDIYEGDILKHEDDKLLKVFFQNGCFMYGFGNSQAEFMHEGWGFYSEIIGNMYENPELLKNKC